MCYKYILFPSCSFIFESISFIYSNENLNYIASDNADTSITLRDKHNQQSLSIVGFKLTDLPRGCYTSESAAHYPAYLPQGAADIY